LAFILNISQIPPSVRTLDCNANATTDVIVTCSFEIDPREFDEVLSGWQFADKKVLGKRAFLSLSDTKSDLQRRPRTATSRLRAARLSASRGAFLMV
jgi:hypothetical protein